MSSAARDARFVPAMGGTSGTGNGRRHSGSDAVEADAGRGNACREVTNPTAG